MVRDLNAFLEKHKYAQKYQTNQNKTKTRKIPNQPHKNTKIRAKLIQVDPKKQYTEMLLPNQMEESVFVVNNN